MGTILLLLLLSLFTAPTGCACDLKIKTDSLPDATVGVPYMARVTASCGADTFFLQEGNLPPGILLTGDGHFRGTPTAAGVFPFTLGVITSNDISFRGFTITVLEAPAP